MSLAILFHLLCAQHVSDINISHNKVHQKGTKYQTTNEKYHTQTNTVVTKHNRLYSGQNQLRYEYTYQLQQGDKTHHIKHTATHRKSTLMLKHPSLQNKTTDVVIHQHSRRLLKMDILMSETC